jgi:hypothetical protein
MAVKTRSRAASRDTNPKKSRTKRPQRDWTSVESHLKHYLPVWLLVGLVVLILLPGVLSALLHWMVQTVSAAPWLLLVPVVAVKLRDILVFMRDAAGRILSAVPGLALALVTQTRVMVMRRLPTVMLLGMILLMMIPGTRSAILDLAERTIALVPGLFTPRTYSGHIAPLFTAEVAHWSDDINRWANEYGLDPNLLATVMQIESCGHPTISSYAGAQGLFQVMPFHFNSSENQLDPDTNAMRGANFLNTCLEMADGNVGLAMACYNAGPGVISRPYETWDNQPQRYYTWGTGIYADAVNNQSSSETLDRWLAAGGSNLCDMAEDALGIG